VHSAERDVDGSLGQFEFPSPVGLLNSCQRSRGLAEVCLRLLIRLHCQLKWRLEPDAYYEHLVHTGQINYTENRRMFGCALPERTDEY
jgi:hypothetical protein